VLLVTCLQSRLKICILAVYYSQFIQWSCCLFTVPVVYLYDGPTFRSLRVNHHQCLAILQRIVAQSGLHRTRCAGNRAIWETEIPQKNSEYSAKCRRNCRRATSNTGVVSVGYKSLPCFILIYFSYLRLHFVGVCDSFVLLTGHPPRPALGSIQPPV